MSFRSGVNAFLRANVPLVNNRVFPSVLPNTFQTPAIVYKVVTDLAGYDHDGPIELDNPRIQLDIWGQTALACEQVADQIRGVLLGYQGPMDDLEYTGGWRIDTIFDSYEPDTRLYRISVDYRGWYRPAA